MRVIAEVTIKEPRLPAYYRVAINVTWGNDLARNMTGHPSHHCCPRGPAAHVANLWMCHLSVSCSVAMHVSLLLLLATCTPWEGVGLSSPGPRIRSLLGSVHSTMKLRQTRRIHLLPCPMCSETPRWRESPADPAALQDRRNTCE